MRPRKEIEKDFGGFNMGFASKSDFKEILEVLLDIRDLLDDRIHSETNIRLKDIFKKTKH